MNTFTVILKKKKKNINSSLLWKKTYANEKKVFEFHLHFGRYMNSRRAKLTFVALIRQSARHLVILSWQVKTLLSMTNRTYTCCRTLHWTWNQSEKSYIHYVKIYKFLNINLNINIAITIKFTCTKPMPAQSDAHYYQSLNGKKRKSYFVIHSNTCISKLHRFNLTL